MFKSTFLTRIVLLVLCAILLSGIITAALYFGIAQNVYVNDRAAEQLPHARNIADLYAYYRLGILNSFEFRGVMRSNTIIYIFDENGDLNAFTQNNPPVSRSDSSQSAALAGVIDLNSLTQESIAISEGLAPYVKRLLSGNENHVSQVVRLNGKKPSLVVGVPAYLENDIIGCVFIIRPMDELNAAISGLNRSLMISMIVVPLLMLIFSYFVSRRLALPVNRMRDVALSMAEGNFAIRADEHQKGELGELGRSLNHLSVQLSLTISALMLERNRMRGIIDGLSEGIIAIDARGQITHLNPAIKELFGHPADKNPTSRLEFYSNALWDHFDDVIAQRSPAVFNMRLEQQDITLRVAISPLEDEFGVSAGAVGLFRDISESERLEQLRRDYVANVSHELRTPTSSIRGLTEALFDGLIKTEEDQHRYYGYILRESFRLSRLIDDLLELSRLQSGSVALNKKRVKLGPLLSEIALSYGERTADVGQSFELNLANDCPDVLSNEDRIEQVLVILLDNAIKYTPDDGKISLEASWDEQNVYLTVADNGTGISKEDLPHIFERFFMADRARSSGSTGLGLSIAKEILDRLDETINVKSTPGEGSRFTFSLKRI